MNSNVNKHLTICLSKKIDTNKNKWISLHITLSNIPDETWDIAESGIKYHNPNPF